MQFALDEVAKAYKADTGTDVKAVYGPSGKLTAQILNGANFDIFLAADMSFAQKVYDAGNATTKPAMYAKGLLVMWSKKFDVKNLNDLKNPQILKIAIANPQTAPYGRASVEAMKASKVYDAVASKIVQGDSISTMDTFITQAQQMLLSQQNHTLSAESLKTPVTGLKSAKNSMLPSNRAV